MRLRATGIWEVPHLQCRFGDSVVEATVGADWHNAAGAATRVLTTGVHLTQQHTAGVAPLLITLNAQDFGEYGLRFRYPTPAVASVHPAARPDRGGTSSPSAVHC